MQKGKKDKKKYSGFPGDCSQEHLTALSTFKQIVKQHNSGQLAPQWDDPYLLRFLRARKFNLKDTQKMWFDFIEWRQKNGIDHLGNYFFPQLPELRKIYPHGYHKHDRKYRPIYIERLGGTEPDQVFKVADQHTLLNYYAMSYQFLLTKIFDSCTQQKLAQTGDGTRVMQTCTILDLKGIKITKAPAAYRFAKPASKMAQDNYPQILGNMFVINAPMLFTGIWAAVKMWIDDKTKQKIQIFGSSYKKQLLKYIDPENLPDFLDGGTCKCVGGDCLSINKGPWNPQGNQIFPNCLKKQQTQQKIIEQKPEKEMIKKQKIEKLIKEEEIQQIDQKEETKLQMLKGNEETLIKKQQS